MTPPDKSDSPSAGRAALWGLLCLGVIVFFHSPRWWILAHRMPGSFEWDRGLEYLKQCQAPFRTDVEPGMKWRYFPQIFVWALGGSQAVAVVFSWAGAWALVAYLYRCACELAPSREVAVLATLLLGACGPVFVSTGWIGLNDAWVALGLCYLAFGRSRLGLVLACVICPFVDERFVFGIPAAVVLRSLEAERGASSLVSMALGMVLAAAPFVLGRVLGALFGHEVHGDMKFVGSVARQSSVYFTLAPLGTWMALRFAYFPAGQSLVMLYRTNRMRAVLLLAVCVVPVCIGFTLAADTMRTAGILLPLCLWGVRTMLKQKRDYSWRILALAALLVPAAQVVANKISTINSLPIEFLRLVR